jgi:hypothetical protein
MEAEVEAIEFLHVPGGERRRLVADKKPQAIEGRVVDRRGELAHRGHLQRLAEKGGLDDIAHLDAGDVGPLLRLDADQPLLGKARQGLGDRLARDAEPLADLALVDARARLEPQADDIVAQPCVGAQRFRAGLAGCRGFGNGFGGQARALQSRSP